MVIVRGRADEDELEGWRAERRSVKKMEDVEMKGVQMMSRSNCSKMTQE